MALGAGFVEENFSTEWESGVCLNSIIQAHYICCDLYCYYYYISSTSDHQILEVGDPWFKEQFSVNDDVSLIFYSSYLRHHTEY